MTIKRLVSCLAIAPLLLASPAHAEVAFKLGEYRCFGNNKPIPQLGFTLLKDQQYLDHRGRQGEYRFDRGLNSLILENGQQYFRGSEESFVIVTSGTLSRSGCVLQKR